MKLKKLICVLLSLTLLLSFTGCKSGGKDKDKDDTSDGKGITASLLYCKSDFFNPYTAKTEITRQLAGLVFEPLIKLDNEFNLVNRLAKEIENEENIWKVKLIDAKFSDGTKVTADDVIYSYNLAINSATTHASTLSSVESVAKEDSKTVVFTLKRIDNYFSNLLSFPIIKANSDTLPQKVVFFCTDALGGKVCNGFRGVLVESGCKSENSRYYRISCGYRLAEGVDVG